MHVISMMQDTYLILRDQKFSFLFDNSSSDHNTDLSPYYAMYYKYFISFSCDNIPMKGIVSSLLYSWRKWFSKPQIA